MEKPKEKMTLSEKALNLGEVLEDLLKGKIQAIKDRLDVKVDGKSPLSSRRNCVVCGILRMDQDAIGMTCGSERCLSEIEKKYYEALEDSDTLKGLGKTAGLLRKDGTFSVIELEGVVEDRHAFFRALKEIAENLGVKVIDDMECFCEKIKTEIRFMKEAVEFLETLAVPAKKSENQRAE